MRFRYSKWTPGSMTDEQRLQSLMSIFSYLLIQTSGDVDEALSWLQQLAEQYGLFDRSLSLDDLVNKLKEQGAYRGRERRAHPDEQRSSTDPAGCPPPRLQFTEESPRRIPRNAVRRERHRPAERDKEVVIRRSTDEHRYDLDGDKRDEAGRYR